MSKSSHALYQITTKALIRRGSKVLVLYRPNGAIDFPGGRIDESERSLDWTSSLQREVTEELGRDISIIIGKILFVGKRSYEHNGSTHHVATLFYDCDYVDGNVALSSEHVGFEWLDLSELQTTDKTFVSTDEQQHIRTLQA